MEYKVIHSRNSADMLKAAYESGGQMLSVNELMAARCKTIDELDHPVWSHRLTTRTHIVRVRGGYRFLELDLTGVDLDNIVDGGVPYPEDLGELNLDRFLSNSTYHSHLGGCYSVDEWIEHPILVAATNDDKIRKAYGEVVRTISESRRVSRGHESIWCPQALAIGSGRAFALGIGADALYPPNNATNNHWTVVRYLE